VFTTRTATSVFSLAGFGRTAKIGARYPVIGRSTASTCASSPFRRMKNTSSRLERPGRIDARNNYTARTAIRIEIMSLPRAIIPPCHSSTKRLHRIDESNSKARCVFARPLKLNHEHRTDADRNETKSKRVSSSSFQRHEKLERYSPDTAYRSTA